MGACRREQFNGVSSEAHCFGALRVRLRYIIFGNSQLFGHRFRLFLFFPAGRGVFGALRVRLRLARIESNPTVSRNRFPMAVCDGMRLRAIMQERATLGSKISARGVFGVLMPGSHSSRGGRGGRGGQGGQAVRAVGWPVANSDNPVVSLDALNLAKAFLSFGGFLSFRKSR